MRLFGHGLSGGVDPGNAFDGLFVFLLALRGAFGV